MGSKKRKGGLSARVFKAQWPLSSNDANPMILIYPDATREPWFYLPATAQHRKHLFKNRYAKVYFRGWVDGQQVVVDDFVRREEWI